MIKTLSPYSTAGASTAKTAEIMSRYRPIAPKPETGPVSPASGGDNSSASSLSQKIRESPYLRTLWPQLQSRPTRTRKRGRAAISSPLIKRSRTHYFLGLSSSGPVTSPGKHISFQGFGGTGTGQLLPLQNLSGVCRSLRESPVSSVSNLVTLPLLPCSVPSVMSRVGAGKEKFIDLNVTADQIPEEKDLLQQLQEPTTTTTVTNVFAPQPIRPVGSCVNVKCISEDPNAKARVTRKPEEVEEEVEREALPAIISDSKNKVRLANSAYKEMVGQPECSWLDSMVVAPGRGSCKRICGEVALEFCDPTAVPANSSNGFSCWVRIEWGRGVGEGKIKNSVVTYCDVVRLCCDSKDYVFTWRFHTHSRQSCSQSTSSD